MRNEQHALGIVVETYSSQEVMECYHEYDITDAVITNFCDKSKWEMVKRLIQDLQPTQKKLVTAWRQTKENK
jgi:hypothetical protein